MDTTTIILVALVCLTISAVIGSLIANLRNDREAPPDASPGPQSSRQPAQQLGPGIQPQTISTDSRRVDIAAVWRERPSGILRVDMEGKTLRTAGELDSDQRRRLATTVEDLRVWLEAPAAPGSEPTLVTPSPARVIQQQPLANPAPVGNSPASIQPRPGTAPSFEKNTKEKITPKSLVEVIDEILQSQIAGTPLVNTGLRLQDSPLGEVVVWIGLNHYDGVNAVPDAAAQAAIRRAVKTWEERT
jgi:hypothetical protein